MGFQFIRQSRCCCIQNCWCERDISENKDKKTKTKKKKKKKKSLVIWKEKERKKERKKKRKDGVLLCWIVLGEGTWVSCVSMV